MADPLSPGLSTFPLQGSEETQGSGTGALFWASFRPAQARKNVSRTRGAGLLPSMPSESQVFVFLLSIVSSSLQGYSAGTQAGEAPLRTVRKNLA